MIIKSIKPGKKFHLVFYVLGCSPKIKKFYCKKKMTKFVENFLKKYPDHKGMDTGCWIDYTITDISGSLTTIADCNYG
jgi:hypothetical protein